MVGNRYVQFFLVLFLTGGVSANILVHSRIKGALMGGALGDAFARVANLRDDEAELITSFEDFADDEWVRDTSGYDIGIGSEYSVIVSALFERFFNERRRHASLNDLLFAYQETLHSLLKRKDTDPFYRTRKFRKDTEKILHFLDPTQERDPKSNDYLKSTSTFPLVAMIPIGIVFYDDLTIVKALADSCIQLTHKHPSVRAAGVAFAVGMACITKGYQTDRVISSMVRTAEEYRDLESTYKDDGPVTLSKKKLHDFYTADLIAYAGSEGQAKDIREIIGYRPSHKNKKNKPRLPAERADDAVAAVVYLFARNNKNFTQILKEAMYSKGDAQLLSYLSGVYMGCYTGFSGLRIQGYVDDLEMLEKVNVLQALCNDLYSVIKDYEPYTMAHFSKRASIQSDQMLFSENDSDDFIVRWGFQDMCDHVFDPRTSKWAHPTSTEKGGVRFNHKDVRPGDVIFVRDIELFMKEMHAAISVPYIIVTHGEFRDTCLEHQLLYLDDDKIIAWFSIHPPKNWHPKFHPLPLGMMQKGDYYKQAEKMNKLFVALRKKPKKQLLYMNMSLEQNPSRKECHTLLADKPFCFEQKNKLDFEEYLTEMAGFKFVLSPRGWGPDCYRTWEALLVGSIPIVKRGQFDQLQVRGANVDDPGCRSTLSGKTASQLDELYKGLPILVIDDWSEVTEDFLHKKYEEFIARDYSIEPLYLDYWYRKISAVRYSFLNGYYADTV